MSLQIKRTDGLSGQEVFQKILEDVPGGGTLQIDELKAATTWLNKGAPVQYTESTRVVNLVKTAVLQDDAADDATTYKVEKNHEFKVDDILSAVIGGTAYTIDAIDTADPLYDVLTVETTLAVGYSKGDILFEAATAVASGSVYKYAAANGILKDGVKIDQDNTAATAVSMVTRGTVYENRIPFSVSAAMKTALKHIIFSQSF